MSNNVKKSFLNLETWIRIGYIAFFLLLLSIASSVAFFLVLLQAASVLLTGRDNEKLREFGQSLGQWGFQSLLFATYNTEQRPFPFSDWPSAETGAGFDAGLDDEISDKAASEEIDEEVDKGVDKELSEEVDKELGDVDEHALPSAPNNADDIPSFTASDDKPTSADGGAAKAD
jgi:hypothetical protein